MKILVTGANGFLGYYLTRLLIQKGYEVIASGKGDCRLPFMDRPLFSYETMDFTDPIIVREIIEKHKPDVVVHAGAISKVDECEQNRPLAHLANVEGTKILLSHSERQKCFFIFLSTDFIFDGERGMYQEDDLPGPVNYYGQTKLDAEAAVKKYSCNWAIVRTVLVYGKPVTGNDNILSVVKKKLENGEVYNVVNDQERTPTYVEDLARSILSVIERQAVGIYHVSGDELMTPYEMAYKTADFLGLDKDLLKKVTAANFSQPAKRPPKTGFLINKAKKDLEYIPVSFQEGLRRTYS